VSGAPFTIFMFYNHDTSREEALRFAADTGSASGYSFYKYHMDYAATHYFSAKSIASGSSTTAVEYFLLGSTTSYGGTAFA